MPNFYKLINGVPERAPNTIHINGVTIGNPTDAEYRSQGYMTMSTTPPSPPEGQHVSRKVYSIADGNIVVTYQYENDPPRNLELSKRRLMNHLKDKRLPDGSTAWSVIRKYMEDNDLWDDWLMSTTLMEQDPLMRSAKVAITEAGILSPEEYESILTGSEAV